MWCICLITLRMLEVPNTVTKESCTSCFPMKNFPSTVFARFLPRRLLPLPWATRGHSPRGSAGGLDPATRLRALLSLCRLSVMSTLTHSHQSDKTLLNLPESELSVQPFSDILFPRSSGRMRFAEVRTHIPSWFPTSQQWRASFC